MFLVSHSGPEEGEKQAARSWVTDAATPLSWVAAALHVAF